MPGDAARTPPVEHPAADRRDGEGVVRHGAAVRPTGLHAGAVPAQRYRRSGFSTAEVAHIHARRENGPRWNPAMTGEENRSYDNLIVLCLQHASEIDDHSRALPG